MHLVYKALDKRAIPSSLPKELQKPPKIDNNNDFGAEFVANFPAEMVPIAAPIPVIPMRPIAPPSSNSLTCQMVLLFLTETFCIVSF